MNFTFRLEKALHFLALRETMKKMEISAVARKIQLLEIRLSSLEENIQWILERTSGSLQTDLALYAAQKVDLDVREIELVKTRLVEERELLNQKREELAQLGMKRKGLESLKEKKKAEWRLVESRRDQKRLDEMYQLLRK